ncbi:dialkylrecorsinol condensing enzyme [Halorhodospira abdelmalekii]|uniref:dialkylrecorsinol condensing enzyme n=1 Tax=Halorhodospira abdelmalekii TaxID=421629 RepID=UPI00190459C2|nr:dialkylrecorsinol condensing enzyme [Halorhodospira abdelmalekii]MBK1735665.1 dialkylrecorsinol condensing enzyme [Halorhodospira abdelmalekii]
MSHRSAPTAPTAQTFKVLVVGYSQTGQLDRILDAVQGPLQADPAITIERLQLRPQTPYPFPWPFFRFLEILPETVQLKPPPLAPLALEPTERYDLVVLGYTVWFLSPSPPTVAFLHTAEAQRLLRDTPVVTVVGCRNMWTQAQQTLQERLRELGAKLCDHVAFVDQGASLATLITTPRWLLTGRRDAFLGLPPAGIAEAEIARRGPRFGCALRAALHDGTLDGNRSVLHGLEAVTVDEGLIVSERIGLRSFRLWSRLLRAAGPQGSLGRRSVVLIYVVFLLLMIVTVVPLSLLLRRLLRPLLRERLEALRAECERPSGSGKERVEEGD